MAVIRAFFLMEVMVVLVLMAIITPVLAQVVMGASRHHHWPINQRSTLISQANSLQVMVANQPPSKNAEVRICQDGDSQLWYACQHVKAHLLVELMIALVVILTMMPLLLPWQQQVKGIQMRQLPAVQQHAEMIDQYTTILRDVPKLQTQVSDCFNTATHTLCYDIKNGQFRRKKAIIRQTVLHSQRGQRLTIACTLTPLVLNVTLTGAFGHDDWSFLRKFSGVAMIFVFPLLGGLMGCLHWLATLKAVSDLNHSITVQRAILSQTLSHYLSPVAQRCHWLPMTKPRLD